MKLHRLGSVDLLRARISRTFAQLKPLLGCEVLPCLDLG